MNTNPNLAQQVLHKYEEFIKAHNRAPLYLIMSDGDADALENFLRQENNLAQDVMTTEYKESKIQRSIGIKDGEFLFSDDLPHLSG